MIWTMGMGKSSIPARLLVEDLRTMGVAAAFIDGGTLLHGGIGGVQDDDFVYAFSESGQTKSLVNAVSQIRNNTTAKCVYVGMSKESPLAELCQDNFHVRHRQFPFNDEMTSLNGTHTILMCMAARSIAAAWKKLAPREREWAHPENRTYHADRHDAFGA